ncbi:MAG: TIGR03663 family protein [Oscillochloris sp.]|nr:TIGR03663 family protein [Oscillochloris sp.]
MSTIDLSQPGLRGDNDTPATAASRPWSITVEQLAYFGLGLLSLVAHFWMLGDRALHHDETLHAAYSWFLYVGRGYIHDPLLHGPLLYYIGAVIYFLFGDNDTTARLGAALAGTALTLTPYLLRRELGRPAALIAAVYLLISPVALYVGRFIRHDIYSVLCEILVIAAVVRYHSTRAPRWLAIGAAALGFMAVNQETSYLFTLIIAVPLIAIFFWKVWKPGVALFFGLGLAAVLLAFVLPAEAQVDGGHNVQRDPQTGEVLIAKPGFFGWPPLATEDNGYALRIRNRADNDGGRSLLENLGLYLSELGQFFGHPAVLTGMVLALATIGTMAWAVGMRRNSSGETALEQAVARGDRAAIIVQEILAERRWIAPLLVFLTIYALFFTAFFSNLLGLITGTSGSLLYWLAQHNVERGGQPPHYYLVQLIVYEPLLLIFGSLALIFLGVDYMRNAKLGMQHAESPGSELEIQKPPLKQSIHRLRPAPE